MLDYKEWWNRNEKEAFKSIDFHLIHHLAINRLYEYFFKSAVEVKLQRLVRVCKCQNMDKSNTGTFLEIIIRL